jgi:hypothetical protein
MACDAARSTGIAPPLGTNLAPSVGVAEPSYAIESKYAIQLVPGGERAPSSERREMRARRRTRAQTVAVMLTFREVSKHPIMVLQLLFYLRAPQSMGTSAQGGPEFGG